MSMGIFLKAFNAIYFGNKIEFFFEFIPQIILLWALFGFMDYMIICKWLIDWENYPGGEGNPPSVVSQMIDMMLKGGQINGSPLMNNMVVIMQTLLLMAAVSVPLMLFVRPTYEIVMKGKRNKARANYKAYVAEFTANQKQMEASNPSSAINADVDPENVNVQRGPDPMPKELTHKEHGVSDIIVHQLIEVIEFVLGTVSNTASYLRLWALSLAHSQLAKVFFDNTVRTALKNESVPLVSS